MSHEVFELRGLHSAAAIFVQGAERQSHLVVIVLKFFCTDAVLLIIFLTCFASMLYCYIGRLPKNNDPSNDNISHRFFIVGGVHLVAHHVTELRKLDLTRAIRVVLQGK